MESIFKPQKGMSLREKVTIDIRNAILNGKLKPGDKLKEVDISKQMEVSRGPVREALRQLEMEGIVITQPYRDTIVADIDVEEVRDVIIPIRFHIEWYVIKKYINKMDDNFINELQKIVNELDISISEKQIEKIIELDILFHQSIISLAKERTISLTWESMLSQIKLHFAKNLAAYNNIQLISYGHQKLLDALKTRDVDYIYEEFLNHIEGEESLLCFQSINAKSNIKNLATEKLGSPRSSKK